MPDHRSRRQKLQAVIAPNSGATDGERNNAISLLAAMDKKEGRPTQQHVRGEFRHAGQASQAHQASGGARPLTREEILRQTAAKMGLDADDLKQAADDAAARRNVRRQQEAEDLARRHEEAVRRDRERPRYTDGQRTNTTSRSYGAKQHQLCTYGVDGTWHCVYGSPSSCPGALGRPRYRDGQKVHTTRPINEETTQEAFDRMSEALRGAGARSTTFSSTMHGPKADPLGMKPKVQMCTVDGVQMPVLDFFKRMQTGDLAGREYKVRVAPNGHVFYTSLGE